MTTPGGGFEYSSDNESVIAKLSIDIPQEGIQSLRELTTETNRYRVELEAANRMGKDFVEYLRQLPQIQAQVAQAQKNIVEQLQRTIDVQKQMMQPGSASTGSYQTGSAEIASAQSARLPTDSDVASAFGNLDGRTKLRVESASAARAGLTAVSPHEDAITQADSRATLRNAAQQAQQAKSDPGNKTSPPPLDHKDTSVGSLDFDTMRSQVQSATGPLGAIMNELSAGGGGGSAASMLTTLAQVAGSMGGGAALPIAGGLAAAGAGLYGFQKGGEMIEGYRQMGQMRGGGAGEGMGYEMAIRSMALNPFLTTDQARKIVQQGLSEGYTGKEFDSATQFVAENLKNMNTDIATSFSLMKKNIIEGGMTVPGVQGSLQELSTMSAMGGYKSVPELQANYAATSQSLLAAGVPASVANQSALEAGQMFKGIPILEDQGDPIAQIATSNPELLYMGARLTGVQIEPGSLPNTMAEQMPDGGKSAIWAVIKQKAELAQQGARSKRDAIGRFQYHLQRTPGLNQLKAASDIRAATAMFEQALGGNPIGDSQKVEQEARKENTSVVDRSAATAIGNQFAGTAVAMGKRAWSVLSGDFLNDPSGQGYEDMFANEMYGSAVSHIPMMDNLVQTYGVHGVEVVGEDGKAAAFNPDSQEQLKSLSSGDMKVQVKGTNAPFTLGNLPNQTGDELKKSIQNSYGNPGGGGNSNVSVQGAIQINVNPPEMAKALGINQGQSVQLRPNKVQANAGWGNGQANKPTPGL